MVESLLPGLSAFQNIHPIFVHFPIAFFLGTLAMEVVAIFRHEKFHLVVTWMLFLGTLSAIMTLPTGFYAADWSRRPIRAATPLRGMTSSTSTEIGWLQPLPWESFSRAISSGSTKKGIGSPSDGDSYSDWSFYRGWWRSGPTGGAGLSLNSERG